MTPSPSAPPAAHRSTAVTWRGRAGRLCMLLALLLPMPGQALKSDRSQPVRIRAHKAVIDEKTGTSTYTGNVIVTQGTLRITADRIIVYRKDRHLTRIVANGAPATFRQRVENRKGYVRGQARNMEYLAGRNVVVLRNKARLRQAGNLFRSGRIVYDLNRDRVRAGAGGNGRVDITIEPPAGGSGP